ncbi:ATP-binding protein [Rubrivirga sp.]|uniref:sensor histidine kinase n=1 Tax=Rubrivirga sp. TaxID=1885344 RepID=UPI003B52373A
MSVPLHRRFSVRLSIALLALLVGLGVALIGVATRAADRATLVADQALHHDLARDLAPQFQPHLETTIDTMAIQDIIAGLTQVNRRLDVYLIDADGMIKSWFMDARRRPLVNRIDTAPLEAFLAGTDLPVLGMDPARPDEWRPFSVARIRIMGEDGGYLYLILEGERYDDVAGALRQEALVGTVARGVALSLLVAALVGGLLFTLLTRRLTRLTETVGAFERGDFSVRVDASSRDEVGELAEAFNMMAGCIEEQVKTLQRTDALRRDLVANVSHDLRSPLASLRGYLETLKMGVRDDSRREDYFGRAVRASERMSALVDDLFDLARFDAAEVQVTAELTALPDLAFDVTAECRERAERSEVALRVEAEDGLPLVRLDIGLAERAIANLLDNALRHTSPGDSIDVFVRRAEGDHVAVFVRDSGEGIASEVMPHVFERFVRADTSRPADGSAGLGLAIVQRIAQLHGGSVSVESVEGAGATFTLIFPVEGPPPPESEVC